jgi:hypothetical protein
MKSSVATLAILKNEDDHALNALGGATHSLLMLWLERDKRYDIVSVGIRLEVIRNPFDQRRIMKFLLAATQNKFVLLH